MKRLTLALLALITAAALTGCGEINNTLAPAPDSANQVTVALDETPKYNQVGIYEAEVAGYFAQTDLKVRFITTRQPLKAIEDKQADVALSNEPQVMLTRNNHIALASVAAVVQTPGLASVTCKGGSASVSTTATATTTTAARTTTATHTTATTRTTAASTRSKPAGPERCTAHQGKPSSAYAKAPTYNGLNLVVTENEIVNHAPVLRRLVQAIGRGYTAVRSDPTAATENLLKAVPGLDYTQQLAGVEASVDNFFPASPTGTALPWGFQITKEWNAFGVWLLQQKVISNVNAPINASSNELLAGQGI